MPTNNELFFIYDSHCPWSYATTTLVAEITAAFPDIKLNLLHCGRYDGEDTVSIKQIESVKAMTNASFSDIYMNNLSFKKDATLVANLVSWTQAKAPKQALALLQSLQQAHFQSGLELTSAEQVQPIIAKLKLTPPTKTLSCEQYTKESINNFYMIEEIQETIGTDAIPALLLSLNDELILLNHHLYLANPDRIIDAVTLELNK